MVYDLFLIVAIWMLTTTVVIAFITDGDAITGWPFQLMLIGELFLFYGYFWTVKGQTLGMQVWKIKAENQASETLGWIESAKRFAITCVTLAPAGIGFFWMIFDKERLTLYDRLSETRIVYIGDKPFEKEKTVSEVADSRHQDANHEADGASKNAAKRKRKK